MASDQTGKMEASRKKLGAISTLALLVGVALVVGGLMVLYHALGIGMAMSAFGSLFLLYWAGIQHQSWPKFPSSLVGGMVGIALAWLLLEAPVRFGSSGVVMGFAVLAVALFFYLRAELSMLVNNGTMLFLLVASIPDLRVGTNAPLMAVSLGIGAVWIGIVTHIASRVRGRTSGPAGTSGQRLV